MEKKKITNMDPFVRACGYKTAAAAPGAAMKVAEAFGSRI